jgi:imidazole glycerol-phosphate synthase subunit HisF
MLSYRKRVIPLLLLQGEGLVKTKRFKNPTYVGDAINAVKIFNEKEVDELAFIDITSPEQRAEPNLSLIRDIASECFSPLSYGGKVSTIEQIHKILYIGVEKIIVNTAAIHNPDFLRQACRIFGSTTIVGSLDVKKDFWGKQKVYTNYGRTNTGKTPAEIVSLFNECGVGEILLNSIDRDGMQNGYDLELIKSLSPATQVPLIACGGARGIDDFADAFRSGASAVAAGSRFVFTGKHNAVLITYISKEENKKLLNL